MKRYLSMDGLIAYLGGEIDEDTIYHYCKFKEMPFIQLPGKRIFDVEAIEKWLDPRRIREARSNHQSQGKPGNGKGQSNYAQ